MSGAFNKGLEGILKAYFTEAGKTFKALLVDGYVFSADHDFVSDVVADEVAGTGYSRKTLASITAAEDDVNNRAEFDAANLTWTGIDVGDVDGLIIFEDTGVDATSKLILYINDGGLPITTNGGDLTVTWDAEGILYI